MINAIFYFFHRNTCISQGLLPFLYYNHSAGVQYYGKKNVQVHIVLVNRLNSTSLCNKKYKNVQMDILDKCETDKGKEFLSF